MMIEGKDILEKCFRILKTLVKNNEISIPQPLLNHSSSETISHYTSLGAFKGIVEGSSLWLSDVAYMNDPEELKFGNRIILEVLQDVTPRYGSSFFNSLLRIRQSIEKKPDIYYMNGTPASTSEIDDLYRYFVASFSKDGDELTMWNTYKSAVSIQFDSRILRNADIVKNYFLFDVSYNKDKFKLLVGQFIDDVYKHFMEFFDGLEKLPENEKHNHLRDFRISLALALNYLKWGFKNENFDYEEETRFFHMRERNDMKNVDFHQKGDFLVPHISWRPEDTYLESDKKGKILPITSVTIAPRPKEEQRLMQESISSFLTAKGYNVPVNVSEIPFRNI